MGETIGDVSYGPGGSRWGLDSTALHLDFFAEVRAGRLDERPPVRVFVLGENRWRDEEDWPPPGVTEERLYLRAEGGLTWEPPVAGEAPDTYVYDPRDPVPTAGGQTLLPGHEISIMLGQRDQTAVESRADVIVYRSAPLERRLEIAGPIRLVLHAASSAVDTDWTARLVDVEPGGRAIGVVDGILRARFRNGLESEELLEPGRVYRFEIEVGDTCLVLEPGHRLGLQVSSSNFPRFDRNPNTGGVGAEAVLDDLRPARQTVFHDAERASYLLLPVNPS
jgi:putative CocE/NonD family hydrolase